MWVRDIRQYIIEFESKDAYNFDSEGNPIDFPEDINSLSEFEIFNPNHETGQSGSWVHLKLNSLWDDVNVHYIYKKPLIDDFDATRKKWSQVVTFCAWRNYNNFESPLRKFTDDGSAYFPSVTNIDISLPLRNYSTKQPFKNSRKITKISRFCRGTTDGKDFTFKGFDLNSTSIIPGWSENRKDSNDFITGRNGNRGVKNFHSYTELPDPFIYKKAYNFSISDFSTFGMFQLIRYYNGNIIFREECDNGGTRAECGHWPENIKSFSDVGLDWFNVCTKKWDTTVIIYKNPKEDWECWLTDSCGDVLQLPTETQSLIGINSNVSTLWTSQNDVINQLNSIGFTGGNTSSLNKDSEFKVNIGVALPRDGALYPSEEGLILDTFLLIESKIYDNDWIIFEQSKEIVFPPVNPILFN